MHLNLTLSAPGGPGSSWGDHENPKPLGAGGRGALPPVSSRRFAAAFRGPRRESPLGRWSLHFGSYWNGAGARLVPAVQAWTARPSVGSGSLGFAPISSLVLLAPVPGEESNASGLRRAQVWLCTVAFAPLAQPLGIPKMQTGG